MGYGSEGDKMKTLCCALYRGDDIVNLLNVSNQERSAVRRYLYSSLETPFHCPVMFDVAVYGGDECPHFHVVCNSVKYMWLDHVPPDILFKLHENTFHIPNTLFKVKYMSECDFPTPFNVLAKDTHPEHGEYYKRFPPVY